MGLLWAGSRPVTLPRTNAQSSNWAKCVQALGYAPDRDVECPAVNPSTEHVDVRLDLVHLRK